MIFSALFLQVMLSAVPQPKKVRITTEKKQCYLDHVVPAEAFQFRETFQPDMHETWVNYYMSRGDRLIFNAISFEGGEFFLYKKMLDHHGEGELFDFIAKLDTGVEIYRQVAENSSDSTYYGRLSSSAMIVIAGFSELEAKKIIESVVCNF